MADPVVLIVDDSALVRTMLTDYLSLEGFTVETCEDGQAGWERILFSETREAAVYWAIMNPELMPPSLTRKAGRPLN